VRVLDLTRLLPGPLATLLLADLGADVVKVEEPGGGDFLRHLPPLTSDGTGGMFAALNRGKRSIELDLKSVAGARLLRALCAKADVLVEGFRPGVLERLRLSPQTLLEEFPRLIVCSISGFGQTGPWRERAGHDIGYLALSGALARCGADQARPPQLPGVQIADIMGGAQPAAIGILAALLERAQTGRGRLLDISMTEGAMGALLPYLGAHASQEPQARGDDMLSGSHPFYRVYGCADGRAMALGALEPKFWQRFCDALAHPEWVPRQFDRALSTELDALFLTRPRDDWAAMLSPLDCCAEPVLDAHELASHPQHAARDLFVEAGSQRLLRTQPTLVPTAQLPRTPAPQAGAQREEILRDYGVVETDCG
jgi:crotonobetainyl-CoA:carnitine CoA-transferase CaiB-like acyl-CoA transferase